MIWVDRTHALDVYIIWQLGIFNEGLVDFRRKKETICRESAILFRIPLTDKSTLNRQVNLNKIGKCHSTCLSFMKKAG